MYKCKHCGTTYLDNEIELGEIEECEALITEDSFCGCREFEKLSEQEEEVKWIEKKKCF